MKTSMKKNDFMIVLMSIFLGFLALGQAINLDFLYGLVTDIGIFVFAMVVILLPTELLLRKVFGVSLMDAL